MEEKKLVWPNSAFQFNQLVICKGKKEKKNTRGIKMKEKKYNHTKNEKETKSGSWLNQTVDIDLTNSRSWLNQ